jgi:hypothetical protein
MSSSSSSLMAIIKTDLVGIISKIVDKCTFEMVKRQIMCGDTQVANSNILRLNVDTSITDIIARTGVLNNKALHVYLSNIKHHVLHSKRYHLYVMLINEDASELAIDRLIYDRFDNDDDILGEDLDSLTLLSISMKGNSALSYNYR